MKFHYRDFIPKSFICFHEGYSWETFCQDFFAGISVGIIAVPLVLAFAIASGVAPEKGLFTAIIAGFLISLLGGSRVQIGGPTGAFVIIIYGVVQRYGYEGLALATLIAGILMIIMGLARLGILLKFIPYPVTTGFTTGIAVVIFTSQLKDFLGLQVDKMPPEFLEKCWIFCKFAHTWNGWAFIVAFSSLIIIFTMRHFYPKFPGAIVAIILATIVAQSLDLPLETISSKFGEIPRTLPAPAWPSFSYELFKTVFPSAMTIALLGAIESLLSAVVADGMTGHKHRSNCELVAQGIGNVGSVLFGGIPATGAIARTAANIRFGAKTPVAGMIHAVTLVLLMLFLAPLAGKIPLAALSAVLIFVAWNMSELPHFFEILKGQKGDAIVLLISFLLTVLVDLTVAVQVGVVLSAVIFLKRMTDKTSVEACRLLIKEDTHEESESSDGESIQNVPSDIVVFEITGPFFYSVADLLDEALIRLVVTPRVFVLRLNKTPLIDATGIQALKKFSKKCRQKKILFLVCGPNEHVRSLFKKSHLDSLIGNDHIFPTLETALRDCLKTSIG